jgi:hypothetical protein
LASRPPVGRGPGVFLTALSELLDDDDLAVLDDPADALVPEAGGVFGDVHRTALCRQLVADHRIDASIARSFSDALAVEAAASPWPDGSAVGVLAECVAARYGLDRSAALCLAVAVTRRLGRSGFRAVSLD